MKIKCKLVIILVVFLLFSITFCLNDVMAVGRVAQGWMIYDNGKPAMLYRVYTSPSGGAVDDYEESDSQDYFYYNGKKYKWVYDYQFILPSRNTFNTINLAFHKQTLVYYEAR